MVEALPLPEGDVTEVVTSAADLAPQLAAIAPGQTGELRLTSFAGERLPFTVERVAPVSTPGDGRNFFRVEARLEQPDEGLRPGMQGVARIAVGERRLAWIWTHELLDWLRLAVWRWQP